MEDVGEPLVDVNFGHGRYEDWCNPPEISLSSRQCKQSSWQKGPSAKGSWGKVL